MEAKRQFLLFLCFLPLSFPVLSSGDDSLQTKCANDIVKLTECSKFASGKEASPSEACCAATKSMRGSDPVCLCYTIQQVYDENPTFKSLGLQVSKLLVLPADCKLTNSSASDCPRLLNLTPKSPEYSLFTSNSSTTASSNGTKQTDTILRPNSRAYLVKPHFGGSIVMGIIVTAFLSQGVNH